LYGLRCSIRLGANHFRDAIVPVEYRIPVHASRRCRSAVLLLALLALAHPCRGTVIPDVPERAQLTRPTDTMRGKLTCRAAAGTFVRLLGRPGGLGSGLQPPRYAVRVLAGPCLNFEATVPDAALRNIEPIPAAVLAS
jgi:hypothetical protein